MTPNDPRSYNPYAPPAGQPPAVEGEDAVPAELATRGLRLLGAIVDGVFAVAVEYAIALPLRNAGFDPFPHAKSAGAMASTLPSAVLLQLCSLVPVAVQWTLISRRGQSLGKIAVGTRIVTTDGRIASFVHGALFRRGPILLLGMMSTALATFGPASMHAPVVSVVVSILFTVDVLCIFGADLRCAHDYIAGTNVVRVHRVR